MLNFLEILCAISSIPFIISFILFMCFTLVHHLNTYSYKSTPEEKAEIFASFLTNKYIATTGVILFFSAITFLSANYSYKKKVKEIVIQTAQENFQIKEPNSKKILDSLGINLKKITKKTVQREIGSFEFKFTMLTPKDSIKIRLFRVDEDSTIFLVFAEDYTTSPIGQVKSTGFK